MDTQHKRVLTFKEACEYASIAPSYMYKLTSGMIIPFSKPHGKKIYFDRDKLDAWLLSNESMGSDAKDILASTYLTKKNL